MKAEKIGHTGITWQFTPEGAREAMVDASSLGYRGIELFGFVIDAYPGGVDALASDLDKSGLRLASAYCSAPLIEPSSRDKDIEQMDGWAEKVKTLGGDVVVVGAARRQRERYPPEAYRDLCGVLNEIGRRCADRGVVACFHPHTGTPVETPEEIALVMEQIDPDVVFMAPDTGQIAKGGGDAVEVVRTYRSLVRHIHLKDYIGGEARVDSEGEAVDRTGYLDYVPLGDGVVDISAIVSMLEEDGYDGWWMVELDGTTQAPRRPREAAAMSKRYLDGLMASKAGGRS